MGDILCPGGVPNEGLCASYMECDDRARAQGQPGVRFDCIGRDAVRRLSRRQSGICCRRRGHVIGAGTVGVDAGVGLGLGTDIGMTDIAGAAGAGPVDIGIADIGVVPCEGTGQPGSDRGARLCHSRGAKPKFHANGQVDECTRRYSHCPGDNVRCEFFNYGTN